MRADPIRVGDHFKSKAGIVWKVIGTRPGGRLELFNAASSVFQDRYHREVIQWERQPSNQTGGK